VTLGPRRRFDPLPLVVGFVTALLLGLGFLQYRWTGELSEAERGRMRASLQARADQMARELDREVTRAFLWLQVDPGAVRGEDYSRYAERYERWKAVASEPSLVKDVFLVRLSEDGEAEGLLRYVPEGRSFEPAGWPAPLASLRDQLPGGPDGRPGRPMGPRHGPLRLLEDGTPVLLTPARGVVAFESQGRPRERPLGRVEILRLEAASIIVFDRDVLLETLLPRLARRNFPGESTEFDLTVRRRDRPAEVVYRSDGNGPAAADAAADLLDLRLEEASQEDLRAAAPVFFTERRGPPPPEPPGFPRAGARRAPPGEARGFVRDILRLRGRDPRSGLWQLEAAYRSGSVATLVASARRRNLLTSFSVLLLLGTATVLLASAARRARRLAERQMEFVAAVSHELRTPVSVICSAGENLADGVVEGPEGVARYGALVRDEGRRLGRLIEQVLDFAGTYTGRRPNRRDPVAADALVDEALATAEPVVHEAGFEVDRDVAPDAPVVAGDPAALARALRNLVENAVKYGGDDRKLWVRARRAELRGRARLRLEVEDHGLGIPAAEQKHLFEPFWRGSFAAARQIRGSGLGLALVRSIARAHGGEVTVESEAGKGSVFTLDLPAAEPAADLSGARDESTHDIAHPAG
jgi:signal transduction histidine kinase